MKLEMCKGGTGGLAYNTKFVPWEHGSKVPHEITTTKSDTDPVFKMERTKQIAIDHAEAALTAWHKNWIIDQMIRALTGDAYDD